MTTRSHGVAAAELRAIVGQTLSYIPETGEFVRLKDCAWGKAGSTAGSLSADGYVVVNVAGRQFGAQRLAWLMMTGHWPVALTDHVNGIRDDNRFANLREATWLQNNVNRRVSKTNKSGLKGVGYHRREKKWHARIRVDGKSVWLGYFSSPEAAHAAYRAAAEKHHGEFARAA